MKREDFLSKLTNGLYSETKGNFNAAYTLRSLIMRGIDATRKKSDDFSKWYDVEFVEYYGTRFCHSDEIVYVGRIDENKPAVCISFTDLYEIMK